MHPPVVPSLMRPALVLILVVLAGCASSPAPQPASPLPVSGTLRVTSPAFADHATMPTAYTCDGAGASPPLVVTGVPAGATVALLVGDPDAPLPQAPQQNFTHWIAWNAPASNGTVAFPEGRAAPGAVEGQNGVGKGGWTPPCPPQGSTAHRYVFTALAVNGTLDLAAGATRAQLESALQGRILGGGSLTACYMRVAQAPLPCAG